MVALHKKIFDRHVFTVEFLENFIYVALLNFNLFSF